jgi:hypothetical protein
MSIGVPSLQYMAPQGQRRRLLQSRLSKGRQRALCAGPMSSACRPARATARRVPQCRRRRPAGQVQDHVIGRRMHMKIDGSVERCSPYPHGLGDHGSNILLEGSIQIFWLPPAHQADAQVIGRAPTPTIRHCPTLYCRSSLVTWDNPAGDILARVI